MKTKITLIFSMFILFFNLTTSIAQTRNKTEIKGNNEEIFDMLRSFYSNYITEISRKPPVDFKKIDSIKRKYCTTGLLKYLDKQFTEIELDWDPFVNGQDSDTCIIRTLNFEKLSTNMFQVSYNWPSDKILIKIRLRVIKKKGSYKIDNVFIDDRPDTRYKTNSAKKTKNVFLTKEQCFSTEANDTCIVVSVSNVHMLCYVPDRAYAYYYATIELTNKCEKDMINHCLNIAKFFQSACSAWDLFVTNSKNISITCDRDCPSNTGISRTLKPGDKITYDSILFKVYDAALVENYKCKVGFVYVTEKDYVHQGNIMQTLYDKRKNKEGIIWSEEFSFK